MVANEPCGAQLDRIQQRRNAPVREHRALARRVDERDDDAVACRFDRAGELDAEVNELLGRESSRSVVRPLAQPAGRASERGDPGSDVGSLAACRKGDACGGVAAPGDLRVGADHHVEHEIAERYDLHRLRSSHGRRRRVAGGTGPSCAHALVRARRSRRRVGRGRSAPSARSGGAGGPCRRASGPSRARRATASCSNWSEETARSHGAPARHARPSAG